MAIDSASHLQNTKNLLSMALDKQKGINLLCNLEGYHQALKMIHWSTGKHSIHNLTDDIDKSVLDFEDEIAEMIMGHLSTRFGKGDLKTILPSASDLLPLLKELQQDLESFRKTLDDNTTSGIVSKVDDFLGDLEKYKYLATFV